MRTLLTRLLGAADCPNDLLPLLADLAIEDGGARAVAVWRVDPSGEVRMASMRGLPERCAELSIELDTIDAELGDRLVAEHLGGEGRALTLPLRSGQDLFGALVLVFGADGDPDPQSVRLAQTLADFAALSLSRAFELEQLKRSHAELRASRQALERTQKLRALGEMAAGVSHDLKNILNPLSLHLQLLERSVPRSLALAHESIAEMRQVVRRGVETTERLRAFSRQTPDTKLSVASLDGLVREATEICRPRLSSQVRGRGLSLTAHLDGPLRVRVQAADLVAAVVNLIVNAIDAQPEGGTIEVTTRADGDGACVEIRDTGPGIPLEHQARIFEPFFTTKGAEGTGLGLAMAYAFAQRHGGRLTLDSRVGEGTTLRLWLPLAAE